MSVAETERALLAAGWQPGRRVCTGGWRASLEASGFDMRDAAARFLSEFGGAGISGAREAFELNPLSSTVVGPGTARRGRVPSRHPRPTCAGSPSRSWRRSGTGGSPSSPPTPATPRSRHSSPTATARTRWTLLSRCSDESR
ncbi:SUKH-3 domain-containing protein [Sphaerimonospora thailandensis]|uniref:SUKH-3 domain-containing protein n=1 Tax=Sphaerimonospora thailandensis TaxID=795644 RepID=UPI003899A617